MWVEELALENVRCFKRAQARFAKGGTPCRGVTLLGQNSGGKSTILQALGILLAGPEGARQLAPRPVGWVRNEDDVGKVSLRVRQSDNDPGKHGDQKNRKAFGYSYSITGHRKLTVNQKVYTEPTIIPAGQRVLSWLRENALVSKGWLSERPGTRWRSHLAVDPSLSSE